jgi:hypothetical protein
MKPNPKVFISGAIASDPDYLAKFERYEIMLRQFGLDVVNPCKLPHPPESTTDDYHRLDVSELAKCDAMYLMDDWRGSAGCEIEIKVAKLLNIQIISFGMLTKFIEKKMSNLEIASDGTILEKIEL